MQTTYVNWVRYLFPLAVSLNCWKHRVMSDNTSLLWGFTVHNEVSKEPFTVTEKSPAWSIWCLRNHESRSPCWMRVPCPFSQQILDEVRMYRTQHVSPDCESIRWMDRQCGITNPSPTPSTTLSSLMGKIDSKVMQLSHSPTLPYFTGARLAS